MILSRKNIFLASSAVLASVLLNACGKDTFVPVDSRIESSSPGSFSIPAKVDILMAEDDTGSMKEAYDDIARQVPAFLDSLEKSGWDYHFVNIPLTTDRAITQALASRQDANWGSQWISSYPGQSIGTPGTNGNLSASVFRKPEQYSGLISYADVDPNNNKSSYEPGLEIIKKALSNRVTGTGFMRQDALLVIITLTTGEDSSGIKFCTRSDGVTYPCGSNLQSTLDSYANYFKSLRAKENVRFFAVTGNGQLNCLGTRAYIGSRYQGVANRVKGRSFDICEQSIDSIFASLEDSLRETRVQMRTRYVILDREPAPDTIKVTKAGVEIQNDASNGFTYAGYITNQFAIDDPVPVNQVSGWAIELHGNAKLSGTETVSVSFEPAGTTRATE